MESQKDMVSILTNRLLTTKKGNKKRLENLSKQLKAAIAHKRKKEAV